MKRMQEIQLQLQAIQNKYKNKTVQNRQKMQQETMALYREAGVNPIGCLGPLIIQMPIWIRIIQAIFKKRPLLARGLRRTFKEFFYSWNQSIAKVPFNTEFLGIDLVDFVQYALFTLAIWIADYCWSFNVYSTKIYYVSDHRS